MRYALNLTWGENRRDGKVHQEWHAPCGCAYHPEPYPHVHPCSTEHDRATELRSEVERLKRGIREHREYMARFGEGDNPGLKHDQKLYALLDDTQPKDDSDER